MRNFLFQDGHHWHDRQFRDKYEYLINIARGILCQNLLLCIHLDVIDKILNHGFNITFNYEAISKIISCSCIFTMVHRQRFTGMAAATVWTGTLGDNTYSSRGENNANKTAISRMVINEYNTRQWYHVSCRNGHSVRLQNLYCVSNTRLVKYWTLTWINMP